MLIDKIKNKPDKCTGLYIGKDIPQKKIKNAIKNYCPHDIKEEDIIALFDDTIFGSGSDGFILTEEGIASSYIKYNLIKFNSIYSISSIGKRVKINKVDFNINRDSTIDLMWLIPILKSHIDEVYVPNKINGLLDAYIKDNDDFSLKTLLNYIFSNNNGIFSNFDKKIIQYLDSVFKKHNSIYEIIKSNDIIAIIHDLQSNSDVKNRAFLFITDSYIGFKEFTEEYPHIFPLNSIKTCNLINNDINLEFDDKNSFQYDWAFIDENIWLQFISLLKYYIDNFNIIDENSRHDIFENIYFPKSDANPDVNSDMYISKLLKPTVTSSLIIGSAHAIKFIQDNPLFNIISRLNGKAIIIVAFLRNNAPERILNILSDIPPLKAAAGTTKLLLGRALNWLNDLLTKKGESYIMEQLIDNFKKRGINRDKIEKDINSDVYNILGDDIVDKSMELLDKYMPNNKIDDSIEVNISNDKVVDDKVENICSECNSSNKIDAKFCSNCGAKLIKEYICSKCGYSQQDAMKFCPECGNPI